MARRRIPVQAAAVLLLAVVAVALPLGRIGDEPAGLAASWPSAALLLAALAALVLGWTVRADAVAGLAPLAAGVLVGLALLVALRAGLVYEGSPVWLVLAVAVLLVWQGMAALSAVPGRAAGLVVPLLFGLLLLWLWEVLTVGYAVPRILLPPPSEIGATFLASLDTLEVDFYQTFVRSVIPGYVAGCLIGFLTAIAIDRSPFLQRGLLPIGSMVSAMPIVGIAPIMVMWFGFDWQSKAAVIVVMTFFPMLVNTLAGLQSAGAMERDLMRSYAAGYGQTLRKLRLPGAMPFVFNALKLNSTLALIGGIVAEFFGTPIYGMGFRISTAVARLDVDVVWATIAVAALAGSISYGLLALLERRVTFWHPSYRT